MSSKSGLQGLGLELLQQSPMAGYQTPMEHQQQHRPTKIALQMATVRQPSKYASATSPIDSAIWYLFLSALCRRWTLQD